MQIRVQRTVGTRLLGHIAGRTTDLAGTMFRNRASAYFCRDRATLERERLFCDRPIFMGLATRLAKPGDYFTEDVAGLPVLMTRGADGVVRAFANICRHRGAPVARGCGNARAFVCPYHGWTYDLAGRLLGTTDKVGFAGLDPASHGLPGLPAAERHGMLFVRPRPMQEGETAGIDIDSGLGAIAADFAAFGLEACPLYSADRITAGINWKGAVDTFLESYHIPHLHRKTVAPYFIGNCGTFDASGPHGRLCLATTSLESVRGVAEDERDYRPHLFPIYQLFPNTILIWRADHIQCWRAFPARDDASRCDVEMTIYRSADTGMSDAELEEHRDIIMRTVMEEDFPIGERTQVGLESGFIEEVVYGRNEPALVHFHGSIRNALGVAA